VTTATPYRSTTRDAHAGFIQLLRAEWTKFRTVRGWVIGMIAVVVITAGIGALIAEASANVSCQGNGGGPAQSGGTCSGAALTLGPGGEPVMDKFYFVHQPLAGNGSITVQVSSLTGLLAPASLRPGAPTSPGLMAWSKAGIMIKNGTSPGSAYAAMMATGGNGVRMQWNYTQDTPGLSGPVSAQSPRWLRLTRAGDTVTGYDSADGTTWTRVGQATLAGLPSTVQVGLFATSPSKTTFAPSLGAGGQTSGPSEVTAVIDHVSRSGTWPGRTWAGDFVGATTYDVEQGNGGYHQAAGAFTVTGSGDIAPIVAGSAGGTTGGHAATTTTYLTGTFIGLIAVAVIATLYMGSEYRRGLIRTTLAASPRRGRMLAAKAVVIGAVGFVTGLAAAAGAIFLGQAVAVSRGSTVFPEPGATEFRIVIGTAALVAVAAVLTVAVTSIVRSNAAPVIVVAVLVVVPYFLSVTSGLSVGVANWLMRVTPAAAFALQQAAPRYYQVQAPYSPGTGFFPLAPWAGFAVLCAWTVVALAVAAYLLKRRDA
jgi:ABC-type transport system involved in multi-copper enzyme maturation permease subunit